MKFLLGESVSQACVEALQGLGHDVVHIAGLGLSGASDIVVFERARSEGGTLVTRDHHFTNPKRFPPGEHSGVLYVRPGNLSSTAEAILLSRAVSGLSEARFEGHVVTISKNRATIR